MVNYCNVLECHSISNREKSHSFYRIPGIIGNRGEESQVLSSQRRLKWISSLNQDFTGKTIANIRVCSDHFLTDCLYARIQCFVYWPERDELQKTMPMEFRKYFGKNVAVIIDCFEIFIERPSNLMAQTDTWSSYKHHNTAKFLMGITPQGLISFISKGWGGRVTDKHITEHSGFLNNILPGDIILADRGFDIKDIIGSMCAEAKIPAFTRGKDQLSPLEIEATRKIAHCRIHIERVIGCVRQKYTILGSAIPINFMMTKDGETMTMLDKICYVCCSLTNACDPIVCFD